MAKFNMKVRIEDRTEDALNEFARKFKAVAYLMERDAKRLCPVDTSHLRRSIHIYKVNKFHYQLRDNVPYGIDVEMGTKAHVIRVKEAKVLSNIHGSVKSRQKTGGPAFFGKEVKHPGTKAQPFFAPALEMAKERLKRIFG